MRNIEEIIAELEEFATGNGGIDQYAISDEIKANPRGHLAIDAILKAFELRDDDFDFGSPGPLTSCVESFYHLGYVEKLHEALLRSPVVMLVLLAFRVVNANDANRERFLDVLNQISRRYDVTDLTRYQAKHFVELHRK